MKKSISLFIISLLSINIILPSAFAGELQKTPVKNVDSVLSQTKLLDDIKLQEKSNLKSGDEVLINKFTEYLYVINKTDTRDELSNKQKFLIYDRVYSGIRFGEVGAKILNNPNNLFSGNEIDSISNELTSRIDSIEIPSLLLKKDANALNCLIYGCMGDGYETSWNKSEYDLYMKYHNVLIGLLEKIEKINDKSKLTKLKDTIRKVINSKGNMSNEKYSLLFMAYKVILEKL